MSKNRAMIEAFEAEYRRYKILAEGAMAQVSDAQLVTAGPGDTNSIAVLVWHVSGNLRSRFTEFLTSDGEKPWRKRDEEFEARTVSRAELLAKWEQGWQVLFDTLARLNDEHLDRQVVLRGQSLFVREALLRSLAHTSSHAGQIVLIARALCGPEWKFLSIPPGQSEQYNRAPTGERPPSNR